MYKLIIPSEIHTEERLDINIQLHLICKKHPEVSASELADIVYASIDTSKYQVSSHPSAKVVAVYEGSKTIASFHYFPKKEEVQHV